MTALLACGPEAFLSHRSAAALYRIGSEREGVIELTIRRRGEHHRGDLKVRSRPSLPSEDVGTLTTSRSPLPSAPCSTTPPSNRRLSDQELELLFRPIALSAGLPLELTKVFVNDFEVDFFWPSLGLLVETDGWRYHRTPSAQTRDALRFQLHTASGLTPIRFSHWQVKYEPGHVREILRKTATRLPCSCVASASPKARCAGPQAG